MSEDEILHHLVFIYDYTFSHVDPRPLPHGQTGARCHSLPALLARLALLV